MRKLKKNYIIIFTLIVLDVVCFGASYAIFMNINEQHGKLNIVVGNLTYKIESDDLENHQIMVAANETKEIVIKLLSLNDIKSKYELYYAIDNDVTDVEVGYSANSKDMPSGVIDSNEVKSITIIVKNNSDIETTISFGVEGGLFNQELVLKYGNSLPLSTGLCEYEAGQVFAFSYIGGVQNFLVPCDGNYKIELWGAQGGNTTISGYQGTGGNGAYVSGDIKIAKDLNLFVYVGGKGQNGYGSRSQVLVAGGYNGGGNNGSLDAASTAGGGATDIRLVSGTWNNFDSLKSRIMVAGGGGGSGIGNLGAPGGANATSLLYGNLYGYNGKTNAGGAAGTGYTHNSNATAGGFGYGGNSGYYITGAGGSGYYGGGGGNHVTPSSSGGGGGGSSFISGHDGCDSITEDSTSSKITHTGTSEHYSNYIFTNTSMIPGNTAMPTYDGSSTMKGNSGNGYAKITYLGN